MKMKMSFDPGDEDQVELLKELRDQNQVGDQLEILNTWTQASEIEKTRWSSAADQLGVARVDGGMYDLVEDLVRERAFDHQVGAYLAPRAELDDLVYAARRLLQAGMKVVLLDWDVARGAGEELLSSDIPVIDIHRGDLGDPLVDMTGEGRAELIVDQGADDLEWTMTVERAGELMRQLEGVDVILFLAEDTATREFELEEDTVAMSASSVGRLAGAWGASCLVARADAKTFTVLASQLEMTWQELS